MNRRLLGVLTAVALAFAGTLLLVGYVRSAEARASGGDDLVEVLVATDAIPSGTMGDDLASKVEVESVPEKVRIPGAVTDVSALAGLFATVDILPGEQLSTGRFAATDTIGPAGAPAGKHAITISLEPERAVGGQVVAGDLVGVVISLEEDASGQPATRLVLHKILVTAVQAAGLSAPDEHGRVDEPPEGTLLVTLAVDPSQVERIVFGAEFGRLWLTSEPKDTSEAGTRVQTKGSVLA